MRQGGMRPHGHSSGTYWIRANGKTGGKKKSFHTRQADETEAEWQAKFKTDKKAPGKGA